MQRLKGLATGIGSLPLINTNGALDLIFRYTSHIPFWPQLPKRDIREGMVAQFSEKLPCLKITHEGLAFDALQRDKELEVFYERIIANDINYFKISDRFAEGLHKFYQRLEQANLKEADFIKLQVTGPFTFAASINDDKGIALLHDKELTQVILNGLIMKANWQVSLFKKFSKKMIIFIDEPYLSCFGSAYTPINREDVVKVLTELTEGIKTKDLLIGIHCCGNTDWSIFTDISAIDIISFDAFGFQERFVLYAEDLKNFLQRGGIICWGIVPTQEFSGIETAPSLTEKLLSGIDALAKKGLDRELLLNSLLISPSCGLGTLDTQKSEKIFELLAQASSLIKNSWYNVQI
jgi:methionine synthase II (cobalamin-independent)